MTGDLPNSLCEGLADQTLATLWLAHSKKETRDRQHSATFAALVGIGPKDEIEGMIAAQLLAHREAYGLSYFTVIGVPAAEFAPVIAALR